MPFFLLAVASGQDSPESMRGPRGEWAEAKENCSGKENDLGMVREREGSARATLAMARCTKIFAAGKTNRGLNDPLPPPLSLVRTPENKLERRVLFRLTLRRGLGL